MPFWSGTSSWSLGLPIVVPIAFALIAFEGLAIRTTVCGVPLALLLIAALVLLVVAANVYLVTRPQPTPGGRRTRGRSRYFMFGGTARVPFLVAVDTPALRHRSKPRAKGSPKRVASKGRQR